MSMLKMLLLGRTEPQNTMFDIFFLNVDYYNIAKSLLFTALCSLDLLQCSAGTYRAIKSMTSESAHMVNKSSLIKYRQSHHHVCSFGKAY